MEYTKIKTMDDIIKLLEKEKSKLSELQMKTFDAMIKHLKNTNKGIINIKNPEELKSYIENFINVLKELTNPYFSEALEVYNNFQGSNERPGIKRISFESVLSVDNKNKLTKFYREIADFLYMNSKGFLRGLEEEEQLKSKINNRVDLEKHQIKIEAVSAIYEAYESYSERALPSKLWSLIYERISNKDELNQISSVIKRALNAAKKALNHNVFLSEIEKHLQNIEAAQEAPAQEEQNIEKHLQNIEAVQEAPAQEEQNIEKHLQNIEAAQEAPAQEEQNIEKHLQNIQAVQEAPAQEEAQNKEDFSKFEKILFRYKIEEMRYDKSDMNKVDKSANFVKTFRDQDNNLWFKKHNPLRNMAQLIATKIHQYYLGEHASHDQLHSQNGETSIISKEIPNFKTLNHIGNACEGKNIEGTEFMYILELITRMNNSETNNLGLIAYEDKCVVSMVDKDEAFRLALSNYKYKKSTYNKIASLEREILQIKYLKNTIKSGYDYSYQDVLDTFIDLEKVYNAINIIANTDKNVFRYIIDNVVEEIREHFSDNDILSYVSKQSMNTEVKDISDIKAAYVDAIEKSMAAMDRYLQDIKELNSQCLEDPSASECAGIITMDMNSPLHSEL